MIIELSAETQGSKELLCIRFPFNAILNHQLKNISGLRWSFRRRCWYMRYSEDSCRYLTRFLMDHNYVSTFIDRRSPVKVKVLQPAPKTSLTYGMTIPLAF